MASCVNTVLFNYKQMIQFTLDMLTIVIALQSGVSCATVSRGTIAIARAFHFLGYFCIYPWLLFSRIYSQHCYVKLTLRMKK